jgi:hypothetical protein
VRTEPTARDDRNHADTFVIGLVLMRIRKKAMLAGS